MILKQNNLIQSIKKQPIIIVIRLENNFFHIPSKIDRLFINIEYLLNNGIKHIEIGWDPNPKWIRLIHEIKNKFPSLNIGAASITSKQALDSTIQLDLNYSMSPIFDRELHIKAIENNQLLIPGISTNESLEEAINLKYKIIKIFPASKLGIDCLKSIKISGKNDIFFIGAGGIRTEDIRIWFENGFDALTIGRELPNQRIDKNLEIWLKRYALKN